MHTRRDGGLPTPLQRDELATSFTDVELCASERAGESVMRTGGVLEYVVVGDGLAAAAGAPTCLGREMRCCASENDSFQCASQPGVRPTANSTVNMSVGMPIARSTMPAPHADAWHAAKESARELVSYGAAQRPGGAPE